VKKDHVDPPFVLPASLFHGTSESSVAGILKHGIIPRKLAKKDNWKHTISSNPQMVYLTDCYAGYFAQSAVKKDERWAIVEVELEHLDEGKLYPDEDCIAQTLRLQGHYIAIDLNTLTRRIRDSIDEWQEYWELSVRGIGGCAHRGVISRDAITRIALYDPKSNPFITLACLDPAISTLNHFFCQPKYSALTRWLMGERIRLEDLYSEAELSVMRNDAEPYLQRVIEALDNQQIEIVHVRKT